MKRYSNFTCGRTRFFLQIILLLSITGIGQVNAQADERIHIWLKAFIPNTHPTNVNYIQEVPEQNEQWMIPGPSLPGVDIGCFLTDHRGFKSDPEASARMTTEFVIVISADSTRIDKVQSREIHRGGVSTLVNCETGKITDTPETATFQVASMGTPIVSGNEIQVAFQAAAKNPHLPSPRIDYTGDFIYNQKSGKMKFKVSIDSFPAFEAYASYNGGTPVKLFTRFPKGETPTSLFDWGLGVGGILVEDTVLLKKKPLLVGTFKGRIWDGSHSSAWPATLTFNYDGSNYKGKLSVKDSPNWTETLTNVKLTGETLTFKTIADDDEGFGGNGSGKLSSDGKTISNMRIWDGHDGETFRKQ